MVRNLAALLIGVFAAGLVIALVELAGHSIVGDKGGAPLFLIVALGYGLGAVVASGIASRVAGAMWPAALACAVLAALAIGNLFIVDHPIWFIPVAAVALLAGFLAGRRLGLQAKGAAQ